MQGLWKFITHKSTPKELLMYFSKTKNKLMRKTWDTTWSLLSTMFPNNYIDIYLCFTDFFNDHSYFLSGDYRSITSPWGVQGDKRWETVKNERKTSYESYSRIFHGLYRPVSPQGKHIALFLEKNPLTSQSLTSSRGRLGSGNKKAKQNSKRETSHIPKEVIFPEIRATIRNAI